MEVNINDNKVPKIDEKVPVIMHPLLRRTDVFTLLNTSHRVRISESVVGNSVIFPKSAVAFLIIASDDILKQSHPVVLDAEVSSKPTSTLLKSRLRNLIMSSISEEVVLDILSTIGLSFHDCFVLHQGCRSISNIAKASIQQLMDCSLDQATAMKVHSFFNDIRKYN
ncbi:uncharacterized protein LOC124440554 [Xenia sp. Carnegie-2017]|uniref:uncharacterized protein LOC124440554 n=1 Tax=Xenia sp. Carnegie-2017 TaxID=2897299 RepID=UPI001F036C7A|nr:uncharacterized protein LOC124440554 [Xenia sp. Carnegie-2017]